MSLAEFISYVFTPLATIIAVWVAYLAVSKGSEPQLLAYYQPNPGIPTLIDFVIENLGGGSAFEVQPSKPIPIKCFGIDEPEKNPRFIPVSAIPSIAPRQRFVFDGGQYAGLDSQLNDGLELTLNYKYRNAIGFSRKGSEDFVLSVKHLGAMPTRTSADQAIVDALKGPNKTTIQEIRNELRLISRHLASRAKRSEEGPDKAGH